MSGMMGDDGLGNKWLVAIHIIILYRRHLHLSVQHPRLLGIAHRSLAREGIPAEARRRIARMAEVGSREPLGASHASLRNSGRIPLPSTNSVLTEPMFSSHTLFVFKFIRPPCGSPSFVRTMRRPRQ